MLSALVHSTYKLGQNVNSLTSPPLDSFYTFILPPNKLKPARTQTRLTQTSLLTPMSSLTSYFLRHSRRHLSSLTQFSPFNPTLLPRHTIHQSPFIRSFSWSSGSNNSEVLLDAHRKSELLERDVGYDVVTEKLSSEMDVGGMSEGGFYVEMVTGILDGYRDVTGLPWWIVIASSTVAMRVSLLPVLVLQLKKAARIAQLTRLLPPPLPPFGSKKSIIKQFLFFREKRKEIGCPSFLWNFAYFAVQFPFFITWMSSIRTMCLNNHSGLETGGVLWFENLTIPPHGFIGCILPILISSLHYTNIQLSFQSVQFENMRGIMGLMMKYYKTYLDILSIPLFLIGFLIPQGSLVYWSTNSLFTLCQQLALRNSNVRIKLGLPDIKLDIKGNGNSEIDKGTIESLSFEKILDVSLEEMARGKFESALTFLRVAIEKNPDSAYALVALGQIMHSKGSFQEAIEYVEQAIPKIHEDDPHLVLALFVASVSHISMGKREMAIKYLSRVPDLKVPEKILEQTNYYKSLVMLGSCLFEVGKKSEALVHLRRAATYDPNVNKYVIECEKAMEQDKESNKRDITDQGETNCEEIRDKDQLNNGEVIVEQGKRSNG